MIRRLAPAPFSIAALLPFATAAFGQADFNAVFVANNGNLEGSVTSFEFDDAGVPTFIDRVITGTSPGSSDPDPGTNPYSISLSPDGRYLMTSHATVADSFEQLTLIFVDFDGTLQIVGELMTPDSPLDLTWIDNTHVAVTETAFGGSNFVHVYAVDPEVPSLTLIDSEPTGGFCSNLVLHPSGDYLYAQDSSSSVAYRIFAYRIEPDSTLTLVDTEVTTPVFPLDLVITPTGEFLYAAGGISSGRHNILGFSIGGDGSLSPISGSPFQSPGNSPAYMTASAFHDILFVGHGTDATCRSFLIDPKTGALTSTGFSFDVGLQGSIGSLNMLGEALLVTDDTTAIDGIRGVYSFQYEPDGSFELNAPIADTQGIAPTAMAPWQPCRADFDNNGTVNTSDFIAYLNEFNLQGPRADFNRDGQLNTSDVLDFLNTFVAGCD